MEFIDNQTWTPVHTLPGFECCIEYYVNAKGDVKSTKFTRERLLKQRITKNGYASVNLTQRIGRGPVLTVLVHRLVALAFLGNPPSKNCVVSHLDYCKTNNSVGNLKWTKIEKSND